jgi:DNA-binding MarR family transcriptional regulator
MDDAPLDHLPARGGDADAGDASELRDRTIAFVRAFGLLQPDTTPCGQPLSTSEAHALLELSRDGGLGQRVLVERLGLEKSTVSRLATQLERRGWIDRRRDPDDARSILLELTPAGERMAARVARTRAARYEEILRRIRPSERRGVMRALAVLAQAAREAGNPDEGVAPVDPFGRRRA